MVHPRVDEMCHRRDAGHRASVNSVAQRAISKGIPQQMVTPHNVHVISWVFAGVRKSVYKGLSIWSLIKLMELCAAGAPGSSWDDQVRVQGLLCNHSGTWLLAAGSQRNQGPWRSAGLALAPFPQGGKHFSVPLLTGSGHEGQSWAEAVRRTCLLASVSLDLIGQDSGAQGTFRQTKRVGAAFFAL